ncbi:hypothetical protein [Priestia megaterium]|uniref:hypothetical protein n=1 Tax=Priestia megaterium TaxID=1404 RepID=UPI000BFC9F9D|nr:hypothetical protein [Priestia megaterium]PGQ88259.1 hypothetical protein COA18_04850 [Priestia megaterium]
MKRRDREGRAAIIFLLVFVATVYTLWEYRGLIKHLSHFILRRSVPYDAFPDYIIHEFMLPIIIGMLCFLGLLVGYSYAQHLLSLAATKVRALFMRNEFIEEHILEFEQIFILGITAITFYLTQDWGLSFFQHNIRKELSDVLVLVVSYSAIFVFYPIYLYFFIRSFYYFLLLGIDLKRQQFIRGKKIKQL